MKRLYYSISILSLLLFGCGSKEEYNPETGAMIRARVAVRNEIRNNLNDPDSFNDLGFRYQRTDSSYVVYMTFNANNSFGGKIKNDVIVETDTLGNPYRALKWFQ